VLAGTHVFLLTSASQLGQCGRCRELGIAARLIKPVSQSDLLDAMQALLGGTPEDADQVALPDVASPASSAPLRILVAEDNPVNQRLAVSLLEKEGHSVVVAANGPEAVEMFRAEPFDVVLMDVQMPDMNGLEATAAIREIERSSGDHTPIVAMTAFALKGDRDRCIEAGMDGYVAKPIRAGELFEVLSNVSEHKINGRAPVEALNGDDIIAHFQGDHALVQEIVDLFLEDYPKRLSEIAEAIDLGDPRLLERAAHTIKGTVSHFNAAAATEVAARLEAIGRDGRLCEAAGALTDLKRELAHLKVQLARLKSQCTV
jgi:CheY-like chemotaxis protein